MPRLCLLPGLESRKEGRQHILLLPATPAGSATIHDQHDIHALRCSARWQSAMLGLTPGM